jgi:hypothetical protein
MGWNRLADVYCWCYWLCIPCSGSSLWDGNVYLLPHTSGMMVHTGDGGVDTGDQCSCPPPPSSPCPSTCPVKGGNK